MLFRKNIALKFRIGLTTLFSVGALLAATLNSNLPGAIAVPALPVTTAAAPIYTVTALGLQTEGINAQGQVAGLNARAFLWSPSTPNGTTGTFTDLGTLGGAVSVAKGLNGAGQVVGYATQADGTYRAFLYTNGSMVNLGTLGANYSSAYGLNAVGQVIGDAYDANEEEHPFLWTPSTHNGTIGTMIDLGTLGGDYAAARDINTAGKVVGYAYNAAGNFLAFLYSNGHMVSLGTLGGDWSEADAINDAGQIVGQAYVPGNTGTHAFLWQNGVMHDLGRLSGHYAQALALNSTGSAIVGQADVRNRTGLLVYHAFLYSNGRMKDLNSLIPAQSGWVLSAATGINEAGQIVGYGTFHGQQQGFLLTPQ